MKGSGASRGMSAAFTNHGRTAWQLAALVARRFGTTFAPRRLMRMAPQIAAPENVVLAPPELLAGDAARGAALYAGTFDLMGVAVTTDGASVFLAEPPHPRWAAALHSFAWLTDLRACDTVLARHFAQAQIEDWLAFGQRDRISRRADVAARRILSWLVHAPFLLADADPAFHRRFLRSLGGQIRRLRVDASRTAPGPGRLNAAVALTAAGLCLTEAQSTLRSGRRRLAEELDRQILADGCHIGRNPMALIDVLRDLLPLRQLFLARQIEPPAVLVTAIDRMLPMLRFFRHGDGAFGLFNGMGPTPLAEVDAILAFDDARGRPVLNAAHAGYQRLEGGGAIVLVDTGRPPPLAYSGEAHAGTLSLEFSVGQDRLIVNCGAPVLADESRVMAARTTPAHSTITVAAASSAWFLSRGPLRTLLGALILDGPREIEFAREDSADGQILRAAHDGYLKRFGIVHERGIVLAADGTRLEGVDVLKRRGRRNRPRDYALRFHLHPAVRANRLGEGRAILLTLPSGEAWAFTAEDHAATIEESIFFAGSGGPRRAEQIVIAGRISGDVEIAWSLAKTGLAPPRAVPSAPREEGALLL